MDRQTHTLSFSLSFSLFLNFQSSFFHKFTFKPSIWWHFFFFIEHQPLNVCVPTHFLFWMFEKKNNIFEKVHIILQNCPNQIQPSHHTTTLAHSTHAFFIIIPFWPDFEKKKKEKQIFFFVPFTNRLNNTHKSHNTQLCKAIKKTFGNLLYRNFYSKIYTNNLLKI